MLLGKNVEDHLDTSGAKLKRYLLHKVKDERVTSRTTKLVRLTGLVTSRVGTDH